MHYKQRLGKMGLKRSFFLKVSKIASSDKQKWLVTEK